MALKSKEPTEEPVVEQVSFDDLEFETSYVDIDEEVESKKYYTITGKEQQYEPEWDRMTISDLDIGDEFEGEPEVTIFEKSNKSYNAMKVRVLDDGEMLDLYFNYPKKDYPYVKNLKNVRKGEEDDFDFYLNCFDVVFSVLKWRDERNVVKNGEEITKIDNIGLETMMKIIDSQARIGVRIIKGSQYNDYPSWEIYKMEKE